MILFNVHQNFNEFPKICCSDNQGVQISKVRISEGLPISKQLYNRFSPFPINPYEPLYNLILQKRSWTHRQGNGHGVVPGFFPHLELVLQSQQVLAFSHHLEGQQMHVVRERRLQGCKLHTYVRTYHSMIHKTRNQTSLETVYPASSAWRI